MEVRTCRDCGASKPLDEFYRQEAKADDFRYRPNCKVCVRAIARTRPKLPPEEIRRVTLWRRYRLTTEDYAEMLESQGGACAACGKPVAEVKTYHGHLAVDHNHETGFVRGLLCRVCNTAVGYFEIDRKLGGVISAYLEERDG